MLLFLSYCTVRKYSKKYQPCSQDREVGSQVGQSQLSARHAAELQSKDTVWDELMAQLPVCRVGGVWLPAGLAPSLTSWPRLCCPGVRMACLNHCMFSMEAAVEKKMIMICKGRRACCKQLLRVVSPPSLLHAKLAEVWMLTACF